MVVATTAICLVAAEVEVEGVMAGTVGCSRMTMAAEAVGGSSRRVLLVVMVGARTRLGRCVLCIAGVLLIIEWETRVLIWDGRKCEMRS